jgi:hypothetical protein
MPDPQSKEGAEPLIQSTFTFQCDATDDPSAEAVRQTTDLDEEHP